MPEVEKKTRGLFNDQEMEGLSELEQAKRAIAHTLRRIHDSPDIGYYLGLGTQTFGLLTEAAATLWGEPLEEVRRRFNCPNARDPRRNEEGE